jgi:hypothetical protein
MAVSEWVLARWRGLCWPTLALAAGLCMAGFASAAGAASAADGGSATETWPALAETNLEVQAGSALDFSSLVPPGPAGQHGWAVALPGGGIGFGRQPVKQRFFSASFQFAPGNGGMPDKAEARRIVTQLVRTGYNAVRLQCVEAHLMSGRMADFDFSPEQFDRFQFLLAEFKAQGIYVVMDIAYIDNGAWGNVFPHRWVKRFDFRRDLFVSDEARAHWKKLLLALLGQRNPYTGTVPLQDPALLALVLSNEGGVVELAFREGGGWQAPVPQVYAEPFARWMRARYADEAAWRLAWGLDVQAGESLAAGVALPTRWRTTGARQRDFMRFVSELEQDTYHWMHDTASGLGFRGLTTAYNNWNMLHSDISRSATAMVDMHAYHAHPTAFVSPGSTVAPDSSLPNAAAYLRDLMSSRQWGKPFTVTEYGHAFWNGHRRESVALVPAYAAFQGWDLLTQFSENSLQLTAQLPQPARRAAIFPFTISTDPVRRSGERLAALLFARADVAPAKGRVEWRLSAESELARNGGWSQLNETASRLGLVTGVGLAFGPQGAPKPALVLSQSQDFMVDKSQLGYQIFAGAGSELRRSAKAGTLMDDKAWADFDRGRHTSDTGELVLDTRAGRMTVNTERTVVLLGPAGAAQVGGLSVAGLNVPALVAASSLDAARLQDSRRVLLFVLTDATNTGIEFEDAGRTRLRKLGGLPARAQPAHLLLTLATTQARSFRLFAITQDGVRSEEVAMQTSAGQHRLAIDTAALKKGPVFMFELVAE